MTEFTTTQKETMKVWLKKRIELGRDLLPSDVSIEEANNILGIQKQLTRDELYHLMKQTKEEMEDE